MRTLVRHFGWDLLFTIAALLVALWYGSWSAVALTAILIVVEIVFSFDNAAINAKYLARLNPFWQKMFLTVGILVAVFGMRLIFPFVIVCVSGGVTPAEAVRLAIAQGDPLIPGTYGYLLHQAHPSIAAFGGIFLLLLFLDFLFDQSRDVTWLSFIERPLQAIGKLDQLSVVVSGTLLLVAAPALTITTEQAYSVLFAGLLGLVTYLVVNGIAEFMLERQRERDADLVDQSNPADTATPGSALLLSGKAAFSTFMFLEVLDASFSFDGVIGAFAITPDPLIIALGLGVGAVFVRSMTVYLVRQGTLAQYPYLEHGAHWAIGSLAVLLLLTIKYDIPDLVIGLTGMTFIVASWLSSRRPAASAASLDEA